MDRLKVKVGGRWYTVEVGSLEGNHVQVLVDGEPVQVDLASLRAAAAIAQPQQTPGAPPQVSTESPLSQGTDQNLVRAPMPGVILSIEVRVGDRVSEGKEMCVLEAMKMEQSLLAPRDGVVKAVYVQQGQNVVIGESIIELE